jgi:nucleotide-binding universal stress UspA family protein
MDGTVVLGIDFSPVMLRATPWVHRVLLPLSRLVLAHAVERPRTPSFLKNVIGDEAAAAAADLAAAQVRLDEWKAAAGLADADTFVREGSAVQVLREAAQETGAKLIVIGEHGGRERAWRRVGTTTERLLRAADASLLIARGPMAGPPRRILVALDDVEITPRVLAVAGSLADRAGAQLDAVHVLSPAAYNHLISAEAADAPTEAARRAALERDLAEETLRWLRALWANTHRRGTLRADVAHGVPGDEILRIARERDADLIVTGRYGVGRVIPAVLGSVVGSVTAGASCPVLVVAS